MVSSFVVYELNTLNAISLSVNDILSSVTSRKLFKLLLEFTVTLPFVAKNNKPIF